MKDFALIYILYIITIYVTVAATNFHWHYTALVLDDELTEGEKNLVATAFYKYSSQKPPPPTKSPNKNTPKNRDRININIFGF